MKQPTATKDFTLNGIHYTKNDKVKVENIRDLIRLNEKGFIEPFSGKDIQDFKKELEKEKIRQKGE